MNTINMTNPDLATGKKKEIFDQINGAFGSIPNMFKVIANSTAALESMWTSFGALGKGKIAPKLGEQIAVLVANINRCEYCLSAHTALGINAGATSEELTNAQVGISKDTKTQAALHFAEVLVRNKGQVKRSDLVSVMNAGFSDEEIAEILAHVALNIFTNYTNVAFDVPVDFPRIELISGNDHEN